MRAQSTGGSDFEQPKEGLTVGRCFKIVDLGTQESKYKDNVNYKRQILMTFELPSQIVEYEGETVPMTVSKKYTLSFNKKAALRKDMEAWYGKTFNDKQIEESGGFDPAKVVGRPAQIQIVHNTSGDKTYANIAGLMPLAEGQSCPEQHHDSLIFDLDEFDINVWEKLSDKMQQWIAKSPEAQQALQKHHGTNNSSEAVVDDGFDDIPF